MGSNKPEEIRDRAEKLLKEKGSNLGSFVEDTEKLIEELSIHQIELEMQNKELIQANQKTVDERRRYKDLFMNAPVAYFTLNKTGNIIELNHAAADMLKIPIQKFKYTSIFPYLCDDSKVEFSRFFKAVFGSDKSEFGEITFKDANEDLIFGSLVAETYFDDSLKEDLVRCTVVDKTKTKQYQRELKLQKELNETENRIREIFEKGGVAMLIIDPDSKQIENANKAAADFYRYSIRQLKQMKISDLNQFSEEEIKHEIELAKSLKKKYFNFKHKLANSAIRDVEVYSTPIKINDQTKLFSVIHDITERKAAEDKIQLINDQLTGAYEEVNVANERLNETNDQLREANATKDKFFKIIAHDLKNPFLSILGYANLLKENIESYDKEKIYQFLDRIESSTSNTYKLLMNLLDWSRSQTGLMSFNPRELILKDIFQTVFDQVESTASSKNILVKTEIPENIELRADENMLVVILRNLLNNAIKYSYQGGEVFIKVYQENASTTFEVIDKGIGISSEIIDKLFKIEEKVSIPGTNKEQGTGLGLLLCKEFVEKHGGKINVKSSPEKGSIFSFTIPKS